MFYISIVANKDDNAGTAATTQQLFWIVSQHKNENILNIK